jgi:hypothetical protein
LLGGAFLGAEVHLSALMFQFLSAWRFVPLLFFTLISVQARPRDYLQQCWQQQAQPLQAQYLALTYRETSSELEHSFAPWQATAYTGRGMVWVTADNFLKKDTLLNVARQRTYFSSTQRSATSLLFQDYGDKDLFAATPGMQQDYVFRSARYSPVMLLSYFRQQAVQPDKESPAEFAQYHTTINGTVVSLRIRKKDGLLAQVSLLSNDDLLGDVTTTYSYTDYRRMTGLAYASTIHVTKVNGRLQEEVQILSARLSATAPTLLEAPASYQLKPEVAAVPEVQVETFRPHIYFLSLKHTDDRVLVVEFDQFLLVAEAPLSSQNGELIVREAQQLAPGKPIKYFVFGHYHPHYLGGIRPFVQRGATILHGTGDADYVKYLATAPHTLRPDSLQRHPQPLLAEEVSGSKTITDGKLEMKIFFIGKQSEHTNDYLIYYFPAEKLLFEDDLAWIPKQGAIGKASPRQAGLYKAIKKLGLEVTTIAQSWPVKDYGVKTIIPFADLEQSIK